MKAIKDKIYFKICIELLGNKKSLTGHIYVQTCKTNLRKLMSLFLNSLSSRWYIDSYKLQSGMLIDREANSIKDS